MRPEIIFTEKDHKYLVNGEQYPSVTQILDAVVPKNLGWWGMRVGVQGVCELYHQGKLKEFDPEVIEPLLTEHKLTVNHQRDKRGTVGRALHKALETYGTTGVLPDPFTYAPEDHSRVKALNGWLLANEPVFHVQEVTTASLEHRYAGTYDAKVTFQKGPYSGSYVLLDLKSSKYIYTDSHWPQLEAYEAAELECGEEPTDFRMVLHLPPEGVAVTSISSDSFDDFLLLKAHYDSVQDRKARVKLAKQLAKLK